MKKVIFSFAVVMSFGLQGYSQETTPEVSTMKIYKMETSGTKSEVSKEQELQNCKSLLEALDIKEAWIRSNPEELKIANETGWFTNAEVTRTELRARIKELENN